MVITITEEPFFVTPLRSYNLNAKMAGNIIDMEK